MPCIKAFFGLPDPGLAVNKIIPEFFILASTLLATKFCIPKPRASLTDRAHLLQRITAGLENPLTLISAPAGFGKSTLLGAWIDGPSRDTASLASIDVLAWLTLDAAGLSLNYKQISVTKG